MAVEIAETTVFTCTQSVKENFAPFILMNYSFPILTRKDNTLPRIPDGVKIGK